MTLREKIEHELRFSKSCLKDIQKEIESTVSNAQLHLADDAYGMTPGNSTQAAALNLTMYGARLRELANTISMLEYFLREEPES